MSTPSIVTAAAVDQERVVAALVMAFSADPLVRWIFPEPLQYLTHFSKIVLLHWGRAFGHGSAYRSTDFLGAALWLRPDVHPDPALADVLETSVAASHREKVFSVLGQMSIYHPSEPVWYLRLLGVDPVWQGKGYGSALLRQGLIECDREHKPAYLESSNERNLSLYERHGFEVIGKIQTGDSPTIWPMLRSPI